jgi:uncharacterized protein YPO0396
VAGTGCPAIKHLLPGCGIELLLPEAFYTACREDVKNSTGIDTFAIFYLTQTLNKEASQLSVVIASCGVQDTPVR